MPKLTLKLVGYIAAALLALYVCYFVYDLMTGGHKTKADLSENQTEAAIESGVDAVNATGAQNEAEDEIDRRVEGEKQEIDKATDAAAIDDAIRGD